jgi:hypothetical protein
VSDQVKMPPLFTQEWRNVHAKMGDQTLVSVHMLVDALLETGDKWDATNIAIVSSIQAMSTLAQAHYAAASIKG